MKVNSKIYNVYAQTCYNGAVADKDTDKIITELRRIEQENQNRRDNTRTVVVMAIVIAIVAFALWNYHRINGDTPDPGSPVDCSSSPYNVNC